MGAAPIYSGLLLTSTAANSSGDRRQQRLLRRCGMLLRYKSDFDEQALRARFPG